MATTPKQELATVSCPFCERETAVPVPNTDVELAVRRSVAPFGDRATVSCPADHRFWVYFC
ncbi:DUF2080 family transposase-associated protein [Natrinema sp. SYSU A 869]|uniref:DUF2080 family transposase-associated protein n=1 Tax=Natrinema sp. SYSU A 869 TaxID=2871694 RepID=UPI001CA3A48E|nr:DUF2080 family transposase-associated protein [Natrinema sp. SYSU A 869]